MKTEIKKGQNVIVVPNDTRTKPYNQVVEKIGNKYITLENGQRFTIDKLKHVSDYGGSSCELFLSQQELDDENERKRLIRYMRVYFDMFSNNNPTLEQLREIHKILSE